MITIREEQIRTFEQQAHSDFKKQLAKETGLDEYQVLLDRAIAGAKDHGITSERDVAQLIGILTANGGSLDMSTLPKAAQNALLARGVPPAEKLSRLESALSGSAEGPGHSTPEERSWPLPARYEVRDGDCIVSIAYAFGFFTGTIWDCPENADLRRIRQNMHVLRQGDVVYVPERRLKEEARATDARHRFRLKGVPKKIRIQFQYFERPQPDLAYVIRFLGREERGTTDSDGWLEHFIPPGLKECVLALDDGSEYRLALGTLDPVSEAAGVQDRLGTLGYLPAPGSGAWDETTQRALREFQANHTLDVTGELDQKTKDLLVSMTGA